MYIYVYTYTYIYIYTNIVKRKNSRERNLPKCGTVPPENLVLRSFQTTALKSGPAKRERRRENRGLKENEIAPRRSASARICVHGVGKRMGVCAGVCNREYVHMHVRMCVRVCACIRDSSVPAGFMLPCSSRGFACCGLINRVSMY